jgi:hypothetical protein
MSYTIDPHKSKAIRKMMKNKSITIESNEINYILSKVATDIRVRFVNVDCGRYYSDFGVEVSITFTPGVTDYVKKRLTRHIRVEVRTNSKIKKFFKVYLLNFGVVASHIKPIKIKVNEAK